MSLLIHGGLVVTMNDVFDIMEGDVSVKAGRMMDAGAEAPKRLQESTRSSIDESLALRHRWNGAANGRIRVAFAPRFAVSCSRALVEAVADLSQQHGALVHTHAAESRGELTLLKSMGGGATNIEAYAACGSDVRATVLDGEVLVDEFGPTRLDHAEIVADARRAARALYNC